MLRPTLDEIYGSTSTTVASTRPSLDAIYGAQQPSNNGFTPQSSTQPTTLGQDIGGAISNTFVKPFADRFSNIDYNNQGIMSNVLQTGGALAGGLVDVAGKALLEGAKVLTPKPVENFVGDVASGISTGISNAIPEETKQALSDWATQHPEAAANLGAIVDIASIIPTGKGISTIKNVVIKPTAQDLTKVTERVIQAAEKQTPVYSAGQIVKNGDNVVTKPLGQSVLQNIDITGIKKYSDLSKEMETVSKGNTSQVTEILKTKTDKYGLNDFLLEKNGIKYNPVASAFSSLDELGRKIDNFKLLEEVQKYKDLAKSGEMTRNDVNELSKLMSRNIKSFRESGQQLKNTNAVKAENTRVALKDIALKDVPEAIQLDKQTSEILGVKSAVDKMKVKVENQIRKSQELGLIKRAVGGITDVVDLISNRMVTSLLRKYQTGGLLSAKELEAELVKNLQILERANATKDQKTINEIIRGLGFVAKGQAVNQINQPK